jgi:sulfate transport system substrate-binding protein
MVAWENEALLALRESGKGDLQLVVPSVSILAEPPVTWVDKVVNKRGTRAVAQAYLEFLYSPEGQEIAAKHYFGHGDSVRAKHAGMPRWTCSRSMRCSGLAEGAEGALQ